MKRIPALLLALALLLMILPVSAEGNTMKFDKTVNLVFEGETLQTVLLREGAPAEGEVTYESSNQKAATVDGNGVVTGLTKGQSTITASVKTEKKTFRAQLTVTVARKATSVDVSTEKLPVFDPADELVAGLLQTRENAAENALPVIVLPVKKSIELKITVQPKDATNRKSVVTSDNADIAKIRNGKTITGVAPGEAIVTIASELNPEVSTQFRVLVVQPVSRISLSVPDDKKIVPVGEQITVTPAILPEDVSISGLVWSSADEKLATVDQNGVVTGLARGNARINVSAKDGSGVRASISIRVVQKAEQVTLDKEELTIDSGRNTALKATVLPKSTDDKSVIWSSSDESVATVNKNGRITAVALGDCEIICTSATNSEAVAKAVVHVQQPVTKIYFNETPTIYAGESGKVSWTTEPANASNPAVSLVSANPKALTVDEDGTIHGIAPGEAYVRARTLDGSNRQAQIKVKVLQHVTGVHMKRNTAYIDVKETSSVHALLEPDNASNKNVFFSVDDKNIATIKSKNNLVSITGVSKGNTVVHAVTEDGGFETSINVNIGDWDKALKFVSYRLTDDGTKCALRVKNNSNMTITRITAEIRMFDASPDADLAPIPINTKDGSHIVQLVWKKELRPGEETSLNQPWQFIDYKAPENMDITRGTIVLMSYQIENDWVKTIRERYRQSQEW
ncbi:MAG: Ig-like domain-containing protein [Clostridia bacterium]|nr:Ig-like domain-containing protein [Clostridia bacterium]